VALPALAGAQPTVVTTEHVRAELLAHAPAGVAPGKTVARAGDPTSAALAHLLEESGRLGLAHDDDLAD
jgi:hypothetical protein